MNVGDADGGAGGSGSEGSDGNSDSGGFEGGAGGGVCDGVVEPGAPPANAPSFTDFFKRDPALNFGTGTAGISIAFDGSCGLTPMRPLRTRALNSPNPASVTLPPPAIVSVIISVMDSTAASACDLLRPSRSAKAWAKSDLFICMDYEY